MSYISIPPHEYLCTPCDNSTVRKPSQQPNCLPSGSFQAGLELILLPPPSMCWAYRCVLPHLASFLFLFLANTLCLYLSDHLSQCLNFLKAWNAIIYGHFSCVEHKASWERWRSLICLRSECMCAFVYWYFHHLFIFLILTSKNSAYFLGVHRHAIVLLQTEDVARGPFSAPLGQLADL